MTFCHLPKNAPLVLVVIFMITPLLSPSAFCVGCCSSHRDAVVMETKALGTCIPWAWVWETSEHNYYILILRQSLASSPGYPNPTVFASQVPGLQASISTPGVLKDQFPKWWNCNWSKTSCVIKRNTTLRSLEGTQGPAWSKPRKRT